MKYTFSYDIDDLLPDIPDEEIQQMIDEEGMSGLVTPQQIRKYVHDKIYEIFLEAANSNSAKYTQTVQHHDSSK